MQKKMTLFIIVLIVLCSTHLSIKPQELADNDSQFANLMGIDVHYKLQGDSDVVFVMFHGFGSSTFTWEYISDSLLKSLTLLMYDRPAFGLTQRIIDVDDYDLNFYAFANQSLLAHELVEHVGLKDRKIILVGHSAGAPVAVDYYLNYPKNVLGLILISPALEHYLEENPFAKTFSNPIIRGTVSLFKNFLARTLENGLDESWYDPSKITAQVREEYKKFTRIDDWEKALIEFTLNQGDFDMLGPLEKIETPVLIVVGQGDKIVFYSGVEKAAENNEWIKFVSIEKSGHVPHEESSEIVSQEIIDWMKFNLNFEF